jgi:C4-dicarboxylate-specific signal transduction histidine kinase
LCINGLVKETLVFLNHDLQAHQVAASVSLSPDLPSVQADRIQIQQVLVNLAVNAAQAMNDEGGGILRIATEMDGDDRVRIIVEDDGPGLDAAKIDRLFEGFFTTKQAGMGMGLPICRSILQDHQGEIAASNRKDGRGARFVVTLPARS